MRKDLLKKLNAHKAKKNEYGLSLMELVIAIGLVLILTVGGIIAFPTLTNNARESAVEAAASDVARGIMVKKASDRDGSFKSQDVADEWMNNSSKKGKITVTTENNDSEQKVIVTAKYNGENNIAVKKIPYDSINSGSDGDNNSGSEENGSNNPNPADDESLSEVEKYIITMGDVAKRRISAGENLPLEKDVLSYNEEEIKAFDSFLQEVKRNYYRDDVFTPGNISEFKNHTLQPFFLDFTADSSNNTCIVGSAGEVPGLTVDELEKTFEHYGFAFYDIKKGKLIDVKNATDSELNDEDYTGACLEAIQSYVPAYKGMIDDLGGARKTAEYYYDQIN